MVLARTELIGVGLERRTVVGQSAVAIVLGPAALELEASAGGLEPVGEGTVGVGIGDANPTPGPEAIERDPGRAIAVGVEK